MVDLSIVFCKRLPGRVHPSFAGQGVALEKSETEKKHSYEMLMRDLLRFLGTRPGELSQKTMERSTMLLMGTHPLFLWPFSIAFCMFTRGYFDGVFSSKSAKGRLPAG